MSDIDGSLPSSVCSDSDAADELPSDIGSDNGYVPEDGDNELPSDVDSAKDSVGTDLPDLVLEASEPELFVNTAKVPSPM